MKISIITIAYNSAETIEGTIKSVVSQTHPDIEYIIIDGGSKDSTMDIVRSYESSIGIIVSEPDKGIYDAMNKGVNLATGDIIGILNSDDYYADENVIKDVHQRFVEDGSDGLYSDLVYVNREAPEKIVRYWKAGDYEPGLFKKGWMPPHPTFFVKRKCYEAFGTYSLELRSAADYELMLRFIHKHQISLSYLNRITAHMRLGGQSNVTLKNRIRANKEDRLAWKMNGLEPGKLTLLRKPLSKLTQFIRK
jgi:glycosyltransferase involved in cell wall biosynthesis